MYAVCYQNIDCNPKWVPYAGSIYHFLSDAKARNLYVNGRVMPVMVSIIMPKKRTALNRGTEHE